MGEFVARIASISEIEDAIGLQVYCDVENSITRGRFSHEVISAAR